MNSSRETVTFLVRVNWKPREIACRVAMCLGVGGPLAWDDGDEGPPFWHDSFQKWQLDSANNFFLHKISERPPDKISEERSLYCPIQVFELSHRYGRKEALEGLAAWLGSDLVFG